MCELGRFGNRLSNQATYGAGSFGAASCDIYKLEWKSEDGSLDGYVMTEGKRVKKQRAHSWVRRTLST